MLAPAPSSIWPRHGGDLTGAAALYGNPPEGWLDLSTGINPRPYPFDLPDNDAFARLPDQAATEALVAAARATYGVPENVGVAAVPGTEIAIRLAPCVTPGGQVAIIGPTYASHGAAWRSAGRPVTDCDTIDAAPTAARVIVACNPNNPDGRRIPTDALADAARAIGRRGGMMIIDEAFADLETAESFIPHLPDAPAVVFRSFGKFFGLAGLRLGFAMGPSHVIAPLARFLGDWPVSGPALAIGVAALRDLEWQAKARERLRHGMMALHQILARHHLAIVGGTDLFALIADPRAHALHRDLARQGVWTRAFADRPHWLRVGLPADAAGLLRLDRALGRTRSA